MLGGLQQTDDPDYSGGRRCSHLPDCNPDVCAGARAPGPRLRADLDEHRVEMNQEMSLFYSVWILLYSFK